jgi:hypothetical protein
MYWLFSTAYCLMPIAFLDTEGHRETEGRREQPIQVVGYWLYGLGKALSLIDFLKFTY